MKKMILNLLFSIILLILTFSFASGQAVFIGKGPTLVLKTSSTINNSFVAPDPDIFAGNSVAAAVINVTYLPIGSWPGAAMAAFSHAVDIWEHSITSTVPIEILANWTGLPSNTLGQAYSLSQVRDFSSSDPRFKPQTFYPMALANKLNNTDNQPTSADIVAEFNSNFPSWYFGIDGNSSSSQFDFVTVVLHEIEHGLGFYSSAIEFPDGSGTLEWTQNTYPVIFDWYITNSINTRLTTFPVSNAALITYLKSNDLFWDGPMAASANGSNPKIYAPIFWDGGSSISHLDQNTFSNSTNPNRLMVPKLSPGKGIHNPGPVGIGVLNDIGWDVFLYTGIEDKIEVYGSQGVCCPYPQPSKILHEGGSYGYQMVFSDEYPYGNYLTSNQWKLEVLHKNGRYTVSVRPTAYSKLEKNSL